jgi:hypothetical protein
MSLSMQMQPSAQKLTHTPVSHSRHGPHEMPVGVMVSTMPIAGSQL